MLKRTIVAAGNLAGYVGYAVPLFVLYLAYNTLLVSETGPLPGTVQTIAGWAYGLLLNPFVVAGLYGAIHEQQKSRGDTGIGEFFVQAWKHYWRFAAATLLYTVFTLVVTVLLSMALHTQQSETVMDYINIPVSAITLFWFASIVAEGGVFASLGRGLKALFSNPLALALGVLWGLFRFGESAVLKLPVVQSSLALSSAEAAALAVARVLVTVYAVALYREIRGVTEAPTPVTALPYDQPMITTPPDALQAVPSATEQLQAASNGSLLNASAGFGLASFIPLVHVVALVVGILALNRNRGKGFSIRPWVAICLGGFFTGFYALLLAGSLIGQSGLTGGPGFFFLAQENPTLQQQVNLMHQSAYEEVRAQLQPASAASARPDWTVHTALAIAKWGADDLDSALESFYAAAQQGPDRSEFYYFYGRALLAKGQDDMAAQQFRNAAQYSPRLVVAERYASLLSAAYKPSQLLYATFSIIVLLLLFTVHEYGHACIAWKLGDDTAKNMGRLTLSPIAHLDLFGSILLPGFLLFSGSQYVFGWAKPVPVNTANFKNPRRDHMIVSFAGPAVNLLVAMACFLLLGAVALALRLLWPQTMTLGLASPWGTTAIVGPPFAHELTIAMVFVKQLMYTSLILGFLNLLPVPPLDGSWILFGFLPGSFQNLFQGVRRFGFLLFLLLAYTPVVDYYLAIPIIGALRGLSYLASTMGLY